MREGKFTLFAVLSDVYARLPSQNITRLSAHCLLRMMDARDLPRANENGEILGAEKGRLLRLSSIFSDSRTSECRPPDRSYTRRVRRHAIPVFIPGSSLSLHA